MRLNGARVRPATSIDIGCSSLRILSGERGVELPLERSPTGELTAESRERLTGEIRAFLAGGVFSRKVLCGVPSRGVSLRSFRLPPAAKEETGRLVALQLEKEFPLSPEELAWGYAAGSGNGAAPPGLPPGQEVTVAALRREVLDSYSGLLAACGLKGVFTLGVLAGSSLCPRPAGPHSVLDIGRSQSELVNFEGGRPVAVRSLPWGGETVTRAIAAALGVPPAEAEEIKRARGSPSGGARVGEAEAVIRESVAGFAALLRSALPLMRSADHGRSLTVASPAINGNGAPPAPRPLFLLGGGSNLAGLAGEIERLLEGTVTCRPIPIELGPIEAGPVRTGAAGGVPATSGVPTTNWAGARAGRSAVTVGLLREATAGTRNGSLQFLTPARIGERRGGAGRGAGRKWLAAAILLVIASILLRYLSPVFQIPGLRARLDQARAARVTSPEADRELAFLEHLESRLGSYLEVLAAVAEAAPPGLLLSDVNMTQKGELSLQGQLGSLADAGTFRAKLTDSGRFSRVVIEELSPIKDNKVQLRLSAALRPPGSPLPPPSPPAAAASSPTVPSPTVPSPTAPSPAVPASGPPAAGVSPGPPSPDAVSGAPPAASPGGPPASGAGPAPSAANTGAGSAPATTLPTGAAQGPAPPGAIPVSTPGAVPSAAPSATSAPAEAAILEAGGAAEAKK